VGASESARGFLPSWSCEFDSLHPLHSISRSHGLIRRNAVMRSVRAIELGPLGGPAVLGPLIGPLSPSSRQCSHRSRSSSNVMEKMTTFEASEPGNNGSGVSCTSQRLRSCQRRDQTMPGCCSSRCRHCAECQRPSQRGAPSSPRPAGKQQSRGSRQIVTGCRSFSSRSLRRQSQRACDTVPG